MYNISKRINNDEKVKKSMKSSIQVVTNGFGKYQKGEGEIACTYKNANEAAKAMLKSLKD